MLDILRANTKSTFTWLIVIGIVVVFAINFGPGSLSKGGCGGAAPPYAARVNGKTLLASDWEREYRNLYQLYRSQAGEAFTRELAEQLGLSRQAMDQIVDRELAIQEAKRRGLSVSRQELSQTVHGMREFQENGVYNHELYLDAVRGAYGSAKNFEATIKDSLLFQKILSALRETVKVSPAEVREAFQADADKVALQFLRIPLASVEPLVKVGPDEVKTFAAKEGARIEAFYKDNAARFDQRKKVRARHILAKVGAGGDEAAARKKIDEAAARVAKGEDFGQVAKALSEDDNTKGKGGELGFVTEGLFDDAFAAAALALEPGKVSAPVRTPSGWHLVQAQEVVPGKKVSLDDARESIARELLVKERALALARERAQAALAAAKGGKLAPVKVGAQTVSPDETGAFSRASPFMPKLGEAPALAADAFAAKPGQVLPKVYDTAAGPVVAVVKSREAPDDKAFAAQKDAVEARLRNRKEASVQNAWFKSLRDGAKIEVNDALLAAAQGGRALQQE